MAARKPRAAITGGRLRPIGVIRSTLKARSKAPKQGSEGAPDAWLDVEPRFARAGRACRPPTHRGPSGASTQTR